MGTSLFGDPLSGAYDWLDANIFQGYLPGGVSGSVSTGKALTPTVGGSSPVGGGGFPITVTPGTKQRLVAPKGYVIVEVNGTKVAMLAKVAYALGLRKRPTRGGGITGAQIRAARHVQSVILSLTSKRQMKTPIKRHGRKR